MITANPRAVIAGDHQGLDHLTEKGRARSETCQAGVNLGLIANSGHASTVRRPQALSRPEASSRAMT